MTTLRLSQNPALHWDIFSDPNHKDAPPVATFLTREEALRCVLSMADLRTMAMHVVIELDEPRKYRDQAFERKGFFSMPAK